MSALRSLKPSPCQTQMEIVFAGEEIVLDASGALYFSKHSLLVVSDLHLEKGSFFAARGNPVPCLDTRDTLQRLAAAIECYRPSTVVSLGDSFHDLRAGERIAPADAAFLARLVDSAGQWIWVTGNHDPEISARFEGKTAVSFKVGAITLLHKPEDGLSPVIGGHYHPKHRFRGARQAISGPCFVLGDELILMPAFGAYAGGLNAARDPISELFADQSRQQILIYANKLWAI
jgi:DNA ligase-associated metallophosphoesterase